MRIGVVGAVLTLLVAEGGILWYLAGERVARAPEELLTMARLQERFDAAKRRAAPGLMQVRRSAVPVNSAVTSAPTIPQISTGHLGADYEFRLSPSVVEDCQRPPASGCRPLAEFLEEMARERRDPMWAADMESRLAQLVTRGERHNYRIRSLECRSTRCAVEVASEVDYARVSLVSDDVLDRALRWSAVSAAAWEENPSGGRTTVVTVATWVRRK